MSKHFSTSVGGLTGTGTSSTPGNVENLEHVLVVVGGTFVATYTVEGTLDGTTYGPVQDIHGNDLSGLSAPIGRQLPAGYKLIRLNVTAFTSGQVDGDVGGLDTDLR